MKSISITCLLRILLCIVALECHTVAFAQDVRVANYIQNESDIKEGGCDVYQYKDESFIICVSSVKVGNKSEKDCQTVGMAKCKRDILAYVNGTDITSYTTLTYSEETNNTLEGSDSKITQQYCEYIKESVLGTINGTKMLRGWFSEDRSLYYLAVIKSIENKMNNKKKGNR